MFSRTFPRALRNAETIWRRTNPSPLQSPVVKLSPLRKATWHPPLTRQVSTAVAAKKLFKEHPFSVTLASLIILAGAGGLFYSHYIYQVYIVGDFQAYPEPVAVKLRRALYYTNIDLQPQNALKYYRQALALTEEIGMDPFSDEILGIKLQVAALMETARSPLKAIEVLSLIHADCLRWLEKLGDKPGNEGKRTRILEKCVRMSVRIGQLYSSDAMDDPEAAEEHLVWAVTVLLKESQRREMEGVKEDEGPWMNNEETGGALASLGSHYLEKEQYSLAVPLFLQALNLLPPNTRQTVVLINNLSACLFNQQVQQRMQIQAVADPSTATPSPPIALANARAWAKRALAIAATVSSDSGDEEDRRECEKGSAVAMVNLGQIEMLDGVTLETGKAENSIVDENRRWKVIRRRRGEGNWSEDEKRERAQTDAEARRWFEEALRLSVRIGYEEGVKQAKVGLEELGR